MHLEQERVDREKYYFVGYSPELQAYVLACAVTWIAWYHRYYEISEQEYHAFGSEEFDRLADTLYQQGCHSERFLFSERKEENEERQVDRWRRFRNH